MSEHHSIAVAGGTGTVGTHVARIAHERGHEVRILARSTGADLHAGSGIDLAGIDTVIDVSGAFAVSAGRSIEWFETVSRNLLAAERVAGVRHHVALSIVGAARAPHGYYAGKAAQERAVAGGPVPWTVLRAAQFFEFASANALRLGPLTLMPAMRSQPVAAASVAARLVEIAERGPAGDAPDFAGPREERMADLVRRLGAVRGGASRVIEFPMPGGFGRAIRDGSILPGPDAQLDAITFDEWLASGAHSEA
ncbi:SDR family oxidoreductase [Leucobacter sp. HNU]|uniref:SDR family oxidoreductase n=1 Tax=Leucobacter sp. HNU TaxID=3236805 RepID=UPI003A8137DB